MSGFVNLRALSEFGIRNELAYDILGDRLSVPEPYPLPTTWQECQDRLCELAAELDEARANPNASCTLVPLLQRLMHEVRVQQERLGK